MASKAKNKLIQSRPEPPCLEDVKNDLERAANNDVAFTYFTSDNSSDKKSSKCVCDSKDIGYKHDRRLITARTSCQSSFKSIVVM